MPEKPHNFWQELKRRKVVRVIIVYAAASYVILELISIITEPFGLPEWTLKLVFVLLCVGLIISIILSWIYDITPEGVKKTKPESKQIALKTEKSSSTLGWKIATYASFVVIIGLLMVSILGGEKQTKELEKSIAVLPFHNDSPDEENIYFINGTMESILDNLCKIKDIVVIARTSVEQYRNVSKHITEIAKELNVNYILEGSGQKYEDKIRLTVQLINGKSGKHIWSNQYNREMKDIFSVQSEIAQLIADELKVIITPEEKQLIEKTPTANLTAYDFYLRALDEYTNYKENENGWRNEKPLNKAILYYQLTLEYDSSFAKAYTGLALAYRDKYYLETYFDDEFLDSTLILANIALSYDDQLEDAYDIIGDYYLDNGMFDEALKEYIKAKEINPNYWQVYRSLARIYSELGDYVKVIETYQNAIKLNRGKELPKLIRGLGDKFAELSMKDIAQYCYLEAFKIDMDSVLYNDKLEFLKQLDYRAGKVLYSMRIERIKKELELDPTLNRDYSLAYAYSVLGDNEEAYKYFLKVIDDLEERGSFGLSSSHRIGYALWQVGYKEEAQKYFDDHLYHCKESIALNRPYATRGGAYYDLAGYFAFFGNKEKAYQNLEEFLNRVNFFGPGWFTWILYDPMFNDIREEESFQNIIHEMYINDHREKDRVKSWLEENEILL